VVRLELGYPSEAEERRIARRFAETSPLAALQPVASADDLRIAAGLARRVFVGAPIEEYLVRVVRATRNSANVRLGASPRATLALFHMAQALAALRGRTFVIPDDVKVLAVPVLAHRIILGAGTRLRGQRPAELVLEALAGVPVPVEEQARG
jgi:MoxR-like ATPase